MIHVAVALFASVTAVCAAVAFAVPRFSPAPAAPLLPAPSAGRQTWVSGVPTTLAAQKNKVVVLAFWTHQCSNCQATLPYWNDWAGRLVKPGSGVIVLSVHTPELAAERSPEAVRQFVVAHGLRFPVALDNNHKTWKAFNVHAWPTTILIDKQGRIRGRWVGELNWQNSGEFRRVERAIEALRKEKP